jgi:hypothetical protein
MGHKEQITFDQGPFNLVSFVFIRVLHEDKTVHSRLISWAST